MNRIPRSPITFVEMLVVDDSLPGPARMFPALPHYAGAHPDSESDELVLRPAFRPEVLAEMLADRATRTGVAAPTGTDDWQRHGPHHILLPGSERWEIVTDQPDRSQTFREDPLGTLDIPDRDLGLYVRAPADVEQRDPAEWVVVAVLRYHHLGLIIVPAGRVALFEPALDEELRPTDLADDEEGWYPNCRYCGRDLYVPADQPGMLYPAPSEDEAREWCTSRYDSDRRRPCAATWMLNTVRSGAIIPASPVFDQLRAAHRAEQAAPDSAPAPDGATGEHLHWQRFEKDDTTHWLRATTDRAVTYLIEQRQSGTQRVWRDDTGAGGLTFLGAWPQEAQALRHAMLDDLTARHAVNRPARADGN